MSGASGSSGHPELRAALIAALDERAPKVDRDRVAACFDFADRAHGEQLRESGGLGRVSDRVRADVATDPIEEPR